MDVCEQLLEAVRAAASHCSLSQLLQPLLAIHTDVLTALQAGQVRLSL
jgi:hypothetical protein